MSYHPHFRTIGDEEQLTTERIAVSFYQLYLFIFFKFIDLFIYLFIYLIN